MNTTKKIALTAGTLVLGVIMTASAATNKEVTKSATSTERSSNPIEARINSLNIWTNRIGEMKRLSQENKEALTTYLKTEISDLNELENKLKAETSTSSMKSILASVAPKFRVYMLVEPKISILAAVGRIDGTVELMKALSSKLAMRIDAATSTGVATSTLKGYITDMNAKLADAEVQTKAAHDLVINLKPDAGDKTVMTANKKALQSARTKIRAANLDLVAARKDANLVAQGLKRTLKK